MTGEADVVNANALLVAGSEAAIEGSLNSKSAPFLSLSFPTYLYGQILDKLLKKPN